MITFRHLRFTSKINGNWFTISTSQCQINKTEGLGLGLCCTTEMAKSSFDVSLLGPSEL